jgi:hypothetical protein
VEGSEGANFSWEVWQAWLHTIRTSVCLGAPAEFRVAAQSREAGQHVHTGSRLLVYGTFSLTSRAKPPAIIFLADCCSHFYDQHKRKQKMFCREMSLWAPWTGFIARRDQEWFMSRSNKPVSELWDVMQYGSCKNRRFGHVPSKHRFLQEPIAITSQKTAFIIVTTVKTSNLT